MTEKPLDANAIHRKFGIDALRLVGDRAPRHLRMTTECGEFEARIMCVRTSHTANGEADPWVDVPPLGQDYVEHFELLSVEDFLSRPSTPPLVVGVLAQGEVSVLFGESNAYKSFLAIDLMCSVATGIPWHGYTVTQGPVLYVVTEGAVDAGRKRIPGWLLDHNIPREQWPALIRIIRVPVILNNPDDVSKLVRTVTALMPVKPILITFDLLAGSMAGGESDIKDIGPWVRGTQQLALDLGVAELHVTHSGYSATGRARGHSHMWGSFWTRLQAVADGDKNNRSVLLKVERHKDWDDTNKQWSLRMEQIPVLEPGETTLVPRLITDKAEAANVAKAAVANRRTGGRPAIESERTKQWFLDALDIESEAAPLADELGTRVRKASVSAVRERMKRSGWIEVDDDGKSITPTGRTRFNRAKGDLLTEGKIMEGDNHVWRPGSII